MVDPVDGRPVDAKAVLVDPDTLGIVWMNDSALASLAHAPKSFGDVALESVVPSAEELGVKGLLAEVSRDGVARHVTTSLVSTARGGLAVVISMYRLPDGALLLLIDNAWQPPHKRRADGPMRGGRGSR